MSDLIGASPCKLDAKGRIRFPAVLKKKLQPEEMVRFVINRGFEKCLVLYTWSKWKEMSGKVDGLNEFEGQNRFLIRYFYREASEVSLDNSDRLLIPKSLLEFAGLSKDVMVAAHKDTIEIWDRKKYDDIMDIDSDEVSGMFEKVLGGKNNNE